MARPSKLTPATADGICQRLRSGVPRVHAAESMGVDRRTMFLWLRRGHDADKCGLADCTDEHHGPFATAAGESESPTYLQFLHMVTQAEADAVVLAVGYITKAMPHDARSAQWWLERRHPAEFKPKAQVELSGPGGDPVEITISARERLRRSLEEIGARLREHTDPERPPNPDASITT